ncbi:aminotransferase class V-fold PLP-dependent enzyme [Paracoccus sp. p4-l81]|uniref:aminotransferase class V-fold PLP-dependent enzyme n=1 Tax=Paracoccus sp. p4-l81 TaxID=3342806 RepID=UPI0035B83F07
MTAHPPKPHPPKPHPRPVLDVDFARAQFPAFAEPTLAGRVFMENAGGSYACRQVIDRLARFYRARKVQPYYPFPASRAAGDEMDQARARLAALMGIEGDELSFGPSTTANTYVLAQAFRQGLEPGAAIVVTDQDHEANSGPWRRLGDEGVEIREWRMDPATGHLDPDRLAALLADGRVRLVAFPHCSNVVGQVNPVATIAAMAHAAGAFVCVDGVSYAPHGLPDLPSLGADIYLFSAYKTYGPHQGIMAIRRDLARRLPAQGHYFNADVAYKRFTPAGPDHAQVAACAGIADYIDALDAHHFDDPAPPLARAARVHDLMRDHEIALMAPLCDWLKGRSDLRLLGPSAPQGRAPTFAVDLGRDPLPVVAALAGQGIDAGAGHFYAVRALRALGVDPDQGVLRLSFTHYTTTDDIARLMAALEAVL